VTELDGQLRWTRIAKNDEPNQFLEHGYFVTRLARTDELRQNWSENRRREQDFFNGNRTWSSSRIQRGTKSLTERLSEMLYDMIRERFEIFKTYAHNLEFQRLKTSSGSRSG
jgi:hypothetical protein